MQRIVEHLLQRNRRVIGIDFDPEALARWRARGLPVYYGDAEDPEVFDRVPVQGARWVVSTAPDISTNRAMLRHLEGSAFKGRVAVACRAASDVEVLRSAGADLLLTPFADAAEQAADAITSGSERLAAVAAQTPGLREVRLGAGSLLAGRTLGEVAARERFGVTVIAVSRSGRSVFGPGPEFQLFPGDRLFLSGEDEGLDRAIETLSEVDFGDRRGDDKEVVVEEVAVSGLPAWQQQSLASLQLRHRYHLTVLGIRPAHGRLVAPDPARPLSADDHLVLTGTAAAMARLRAEVLDQA